jgi:predicted CoA-binding protein
MATTKQQVDDFWKLKRLAVVGVSRDPQHFSNRVWQALRERGYEAAPVNPNAAEVGGLPCYARVQDIQPPVEGALVMTPPQVTEQIVRDCAQAGIRRVWMHRGEGIGSVSQAAVEFCQANGIDVIPGQCPFMFMPGTSFFHRIHGFVRKLTGEYPK